MCRPEPGPPVGHSASIPEMLRPSLELLSNELAEGACLRRSQIALLALGIRVEHVERLLDRRPVVDHPQATALPSPWPRPPQLAKPAAASNDWALFRPQHERDLQAAIVLVVDQPF